MLKIEQIMRGLGARGENELSVVLSDGSVHGIIIGKVATGEDDLSIGSELLISHLEDLLKTHPFILEEPK